VQAFKIFKSYSLDVNNYFKTNTLTTNSFIRQLEVLRIKLTPEQLNALLKKFKHENSEFETNLRKLKEVFNKWENTNVLID